MPLDGIHAPSGGEFVWRPQAGPQEALLSCPADEILFGGARGGGKTAGACGSWLDHAGRWGAAAQGIFFRRRFKDLEAAHLQMVKFFRPLGAVWRAMSNSWLFPNGATLRLRHLWDERDCDAYQGHEYTWMCFEEAGQWPTSKALDTMRATLRSTAGVKPLLLLTANPGGAGHNWLKQRYIVPWRRGYRPIVDAATQQVRVFIPSLLSDNAILTAADPLYRRRLMQLGSKSLVKAWLEGDWDVVAGGAFDDVWMPDRQLLSPNFIPPPTWRWRRALDWGSEKPAAIGLWAVSDGNSPKEGEGEGRLFPKGSIVLCGEVYTVARDDSGEARANEGLGWTNDRLGKEIAKACAAHTWHESVADPSIFIRQGGPSIYDQMAAAARSVGDPFAWVRADNSRIAGWQRLRSMMTASASDRPEGPGVWVVETCREWIRTVPVLQRDQTKPDDVDTEAEDHHGDQTRYAAMAGARRHEGVAPVIVR